MYLNLYDCVVRMLDSSKFVVNHVEDDEDMNILGHGYAFHSDIIRRWVPPYSSLVADKL